MARPKLQIDSAQVEELAAINCSLSEMAAVLNCSEDTLGRRFADVIQKGRERGRMSLKRKQYESAMSGNTTMLIWLGKQLLGQRDQSRTEISGPDGRPIQHEDMAKLSDDQLDAKIAALLEKSKRPST